MIGVETPTSGAVGKRIAPWIKGKVESDERLAAVSPFAATTSTEEFHRLTLRGAMIESDSPNSTTPTAPNEFALRSAVSGLPSAQVARFAEGVPVRSRLRIARLFEAGEYPDKQVTITSGDLDRIAMAFTRAARPCPVKIEHMDTPFDPVGHLVAVYRKADTLCGILAFTEKAEAYLEECGVQHLSVQLMPQRTSEAKDGSPDELDEPGFDTPYTLAEVSLVLHPRIASAGFMPPGGDPLTFSTPVPALFPRPGGERVEFTARDADRIARLRAEGRLTPAMEPFVALLLAAKNTEESAAVTQLLDMLPVAQPRGARVPVSFGAGGKMPSGGAMKDDPDTDYPPDAVVDMATKMGLDPVRMWKNVKLLRQVINPQ